MKKTSDHSVDELQAYLDTQMSNTEHDRSLYALAEQQLSVLLALFTLPEQGAAQKAVEFSHRYIMSSTHYLAAYQALAEESHIGGYTRAFLYTAQQFFFTPHPIVDASTGKHALLCKAYLFHRMLEELNDRVALERQLPLVPNDIAHTNLIVHTLIGDEHANLLDQSVLIQLEIISSQQSEKAEGIFQQSSTLATTTALKNNGWDKTYNDWPCLKENMMDIFY
jgi:hypothetical protein